MLAYSLFAAAGPAIVAAAPQGSPNLGGTVVTHPRNTEVQRFARLPRAGGLFDTAMFASDAEGGGDGGDGGSGGDPASGVYSKLFGGLGAAKKADVENNPAANQTQAAAALAKQNLPQEQGKVKPPKQVPDFPEKFSEEADTAPVSPAVNAAGGPVPTAPTAPISEAYNQQPQAPNSE